MKRLLKGLLGLLVAVLLLAGGLLGAAWWNSERAMAVRYAIDDPPLQRSSDPAVLERGAHLYITRGCGECHGEHGEGKLVMDAGPVIRLVAPNLTPARLDPAYDVDRIAAAVRHAVAHDGRPLVFMPSEDWLDLGDEDVSALASHVLGLAAVQNDPGAIEIRPLGRILHLLGQFPLLPAEHIDHTPRARATPEPTPTVAYGAYVAQVCQGCHRPDLAGGMEFGPDDPRSSNLTPHADGLAGWSEADFERALRQGRRPDGSELHPMMPWQATAKLTEVEMAALWAFISQVPPVPDPN